MTPDKRKIDDPELNQDATYDKKAEEDFDDSDDFHKNDDTALDESGVEMPKRDSLQQSQSTGLNNETDTLNTDGRFDGSINI